MVRARGFKKFGRGVRRGFNRVKKFIGKTTGHTKTLLGRVDKLTGGQATAALMAHPYGQAALTGLNTADAAFNG